MTWLTRRNFLFDSAALALVPAGGVGGAFAAGAGRPRLFALIVGIDKYKGRIGTRANGSVTYRAISELHGCVTDANSIYDAVKPIAAVDPTKLINEQVSRASFLAAWNQMVAKSAKGDTLLVTYSGHGGQETSADAGAVAHTPNRLHDTFILPTFDNIDPVLRAERILDDEMQGLWRSVEGRNTVIFVADSCHAGGMTRSVDPRVAHAIQYRWGGSYIQEGDLAPATALPTAPTRLELPHVIFLPAAQHDELVPEIPIEGRIQGALSLSFARAVSGQADDDGDGIITGAELSRYVLRSVHAFSDSSQHPNVRWPHANIMFGFSPDDPLIYLSKTSRPVAPPVDDSNAVRLQLLNCPPDRRAWLAANLKHADLAGRPQMHDLTWDADTREVIDHLGAIVASRVDIGDLQSVVDRTYAIKLLRRIAAESRIAMRLLLPGESPGDPPSRESDGIHKRGRYITLRVTEMTLPRFEVFNIGGDGTVQFLANDGGGYERSVRRVPNGIETDLVVAAPFGADYWVTIAAPKDAAGLVDAIATLDRQELERKQRGQEGMGKKGSAALIEELERNPRDSQVQVALQGVFTSE